MTIWRPSYLGSCSTLAVGPSVVLDPVQQFGAKLLVRHFASTKSQGHLDLVTLLEEALYRAHLHLIIVIVDHRAELDLLDLDDLLLLARFRGLLLGLEFVLAVIKDFANRRHRVGRDLTRSSPACWAISKAAWNSTAP